MKVTVDCDRWCRGGSTKLGGTYGPTCLLNEEGYRCCLGFVAKKLGYENKALLNWELPEEVSYHPKEKGNVLCSFRGSEPGKRYYVNSDFTNRAVKLNDDPAIDDGKRMQALRTLGREFGVEFKFRHVPPKRKEKKHGN